jgi:sugar diacid utilization regulator
MASVVTPAGSKMIRSTSGIVEVLMLLMLLTSCREGRQAKQWMKQLNRVLISDLTRF